MTEIQSVIGRIQLQRMHDWHARRKNNAESILNACSKYPALRAPKISSDCEHAYYKAYVYIQPERLNPGWARDDVIESINAEGVPCYQGTCPEIYLEKAFDNTAWRPKTRLREARELGDTSLMFLVHPSLTEADIAATCGAIDKVMTKASYSC